MDTLINSFEKMMNFENNKQEKECAIVPQLVGILPNPIHKLCMLKAYTWIVILWFLYAGFHVTSMALDHALYEVTVGGNGIHGTNIASVAMFENFRGRLS